MTDVLESPMTCDSCGKSNETVAQRNCGYYEDVHDDPNHEEIVCDDCEYQHCMDI